MQQGAGGSPFLHGTQEWEEMEKNIESYITDIVHSPNKGMPEDDGRIGCRIGGISSQISDEWGMMASFYRAAEPDHQFSPVILVIDADDDPCISQAASKVSDR